MHDLGVLCEPDSREPWFVSAAHDEVCLARTLEAFETAVAETAQTLGTGKRERSQAVGAC
jgi:glutamate-1-semialdehyde 2,1-aminomutase